MFLRSNHGQGDYQAFSGIKVEPQSADSKDVKVVYDGLLFKSGAQEIYMHSGFGKRQKWENVYDHRMEKTGRGWQQRGKLDFCSNSVVKTEGVSYGHSFFLGCNLAKIRAGESGDVQHLTRFPDLWA